MTIYDYAIQMEKDGEKYYRDLARDSGNAELSKILTWLADEEVKHQQVFEQMQSGGSPDFSQTTILKDAKNVFQKMKESGVGSIGKAQTDVYKKAQELETKTIDFYTEKSKEVSDPGQKDIFLKVAEEERKHYFLLDNLIEFVSRPDSWVENAEFNHLEEY